jgi:solute carrier family 41
LGSRQFKQLTFSGQLNSGSGLVLQAYVDQFDGFALMAPVVMAISGAAGSIYVSRISTSLHSSSTEHYLIVALALWALTCPVLYLFLLLAWVTGQVTVTFTFAVAFIVAVGLQVRYSASGHLPASS